MKQNQRDSPIVRISKMLSYILRHGAQEKGIEIRNDGYVRVDDILQLNDFQKLKITKKNLEMVVLNNQKKRYEMISEMINGQQVQLIRAVQGHTIKEIDDELLLRQVKDHNEFPFIIHGTSLEEWNIICKSGLSRKGRNHIQFAIGLPNEDFVVSGIRLSSQIIIELDLEKALADNILFYVSKNDLVLTPGVDGIIEPQYFRLVYDKIRKSFIKGDEVNDEFEQKKQKLDSNQSYIRHHSILLRLEREYQAKRSQQSYETPTADPDNRGIQDQNFQIKYNTPTPDFQTQNEKNDLNQQFQETPTLYYQTQTEQQTDIIQQFQETPTPFKIEGLQNSDELFQQNSYMGEEKMQAKYDDI